MKRATLFVTVAACALGLTVNARSSVAETQASHAPRAIALEVLIVRTIWGPNDERSLPLSGPTDEVAGVSESWSQRARLWPWIAFR